MRLWAQTLPLQHRCNNTWVWMGIDRSDEGLWLRLPPEDSYFTAFESLCMKVGKRRPGSPSHRAGLSTKSSFLGQRHATGSYTAVCRGSGCNSRVGILPFSFKETQKYLTSIRHQHATCWLVVVPHVNTKPRAFPSVVHRALQSRALGSCRVKNRRGAGRKGRWARAPGFQGSRRRAVPGSHTHLARK